MDACEKMYCFANKWVNQINLGNMLNLFYKFNFSTLSCKLHSLPNIFSECSNIQIKQFKYFSKIFNNECENIYYTCILEMTNFNLF